MQLLFVDGDGQTPTKSSEHERAKAQEINVLKVEFEPPVIKRPLIPKPDSCSRECKPVHESDDDASNQPHHHQRDGQIKTVHRLVPEKL